MLEYYSPYQLVNLTRVERIALQRLKRNESIIITKVDKGDNTVITDTSHLAELAHKHLSYINTYLLLKYDPTPEVVLRFNQYILDCLRRGVISQRQHDKTTPFGEHVHTNDVLPA